MARSLASSVPGELSMKKMELKNFYIAGSGRGGLQPPPPRLLPGLKAFASE